MCHQNSARFYKKVAYDTNYTGMADSLAEGRRLAGVMADKQVMMMGNHGILSVATSTALAFEYLYYFERSCMFQVCQVGLLNTLRYAVEQINRYFNYVKFCLRKKKSL